MAASPPIEILIKDCADIWCPPSSLYLNSASTSASTSTSTPTSNPSTSKSILSRHPILVSEEILSIYCPQCLTRDFDSEDGVAGGGVSGVKYRHCSSCLACPHCGGIMIQPPLLTTAGSGGGVDRMICSNCYWSYTPSSSASKSSVDSARTYIDALIKRCNGNANAKAVRASISMTSLDHFPAPSLPDSSTASISGASSSSLRRRWQFSDLEAKLRQGNSGSSEYSSASLALPHLTTSSSIPPRPVACVSKQILRSLPSTTTSSAAGASSGSGGGSLAVGRGVILSLPKVLPLESGRGKWFDKSTCYSFSMPRFVLLPPLPNICSDGDDGGGAMALKLKISNPSDRDLRITINPLSPAPPATSYVVEKDGEVNGQFRLCPALSSWTISYPQEAFSFTLEAFEDDLLRDEDDAQSKQTVATSSSSPIDNSRDDGRETLWKAVIVHHEAVLSVPLFPPQDGAGMEGGWEVNLVLEVDDLRLALKIRKEASQ
eukprot:gene9449-10439_t